jgi:hypothetical protein
MTFGGGTFTRISWTAHFSHFSRSGRGPQMRSQSERHRGASHCWHDPASGAHAGTGQDGEPSAPGGHRSSTTDTPGLTAGAPVPAGGHDPAERAEC